MSDLPECIWIASYPKSGNTWVRFIITAAIYGKIPGSIFIEAVIPDIHHGQSIWQFWEYSPIKIAKTHLEAGTHFQIAQELKGKIGRQRAIYIVRNPLDVACSFVRYENFPLSLIDNFIEMGGGCSYYDQGFGWWADNVQTWREAMLPEDLLILRYEDMLKEPAVGVEKILRFIGLPAEPDNIAQVVRDCDFKNLQAMEKQEKETTTPGFFINHTINHQGDFMKEGRFGSFRDVMTPDQIRRAIDRFGAVMQDVGYDLQDFAP
jgi:hypothetical protein